MTGLARTDLATLDKIHLAAGALAGQGQWGSITQLAAQFGVSRPTVYAAGEQGERVLHRHFEAGGTGEVWVRVDRRQLERAVITLRAASPNSLRPIEDMLPVLYPGVSLSYGSVHSIVGEAQERARAFNATVDLSAIHAVAVDEMFSQGEPVLAGVDLDSGYLFALDHRQSRGGDDWEEVLADAKRRGLQLQTVVKDAASGIASGVSRVFASAEQRDDCFHAKYEMSKCLRVLESQAYKAIAGEGQLEQRIAALPAGKKTTTSKLASLQSQLWRVRRRCADKVELYDAFDAAVERACAGMEVVDVVNVGLQSPEHMRTELFTASAEMSALDNWRANKVGKYLANRTPGLVLYAVEMHSSLNKAAALYGADAVLLAALVLQLLAVLRRRTKCRHKRQRQQQLVAAFDLLGKQPCGEAALAQVQEIFHHRHRASSAIEGFNAALRPHLYVHKKVNQGFLELFRARYNLRSRRWGRHKGSTAHTLITGEAVSDWLSMIGYPPTNLLN